MRAETTRRVVLPAALPGIFAGIVLGFGRAISETMIVLRASGNAAITSWSFTESVRTLSASVAAVVEKDADQAQQVLKDEARINQMEIEIDDLATRLLAGMLPTVWIPSVVLQHAKDLPLYRSHLLRFGTLLLMDPIHDGTLPRGSWDFSPCARRRCTVPQ